jgi:hypothetical protein
LNEWLLRDPPVNDKHAVRAGAVCTMKFDSFTFSQLRKRESVSVGERKAGLVVGKTVRRVFATKCIRRLERLERLELFERPTFAGDRGFGKNNMIAISDPADPNGLSSRGDPAPRSGREMEAMDTLKPEIARLFAA